ncbi:MAG TPA: exodeoxyribonuclease VII large subunit [Casimicrobiaceae bacterium]|nr:exodeoxyribonuclease VII large subunit [Casimicrobiaceae bacterium]
MQTPAAPVLPVSLFMSSARLLLEKHLGLVWVGGEVSQCTRAASGHLYFTLKDAHAQVRCVFFRTKAQHLDFALKEGLAIEVRAVPSIYEARGEFQLNVEHIRRAGLGALYERFERLKARLSAAGWFAQERKRALPVFPRRIGIITSPRGAALRDVLTTLSRRWPGLRVVIYPAVVQGDSAAHAVATAVRIANARAEVDVLLVCRGGGSLEDLWAFNEEILARAVFESHLPVVSGVGHETDFTICDFVADVRAATPTAAAMLLVPDAAELRRRLAHTAHRLGRAHRHGLSSAMQRLDAASRRLTHPAARIARQTEQTRALALRLRRAMRLRLRQHNDDARTLTARLLRELRAPLPQGQRLTQNFYAWRSLGTARLLAVEQRLSALRQHLAHLDPERVLARGYALVADAEGRVVTRSSQLDLGDRVSIRFAHGRAGAVISERSD